MGKLTVTIADDNPLTVAKAAETTFSPDDLSNLEAWYDASDDDQFSLSGVKVTEWKDKSGNLRHLTQGTDARRPDLDAANDRVHFDASTLEWLRSADWSVLQPMTIYIKMQQITITGTQFIFDSAFTTALDRVIVSMINGYFRFSAGDAFDFAEADTDPHIITAIANGATSEAILDNDSTEDSGGVNKLRGITLGAAVTDAVGMNGYIKQVLVYSGVHSTIDQSQVKNWLAGK